MAATRWDAASARARAAPTPAPRRTTLTTSASAAAATVPAADARKTAWPVPVWPDRSSAPNAPSARTPYTLRSSQP